MLGASTDKEVGGTVVTETLTIREARKRVGIGLGRCSRLADVDVRSLIRYEQRRAQPGIRNAARIAAVLGVRVDEIDEFIPAVREVEAAGFVLADANGHEEEQD